MTCNNIIVNGVSPVFPLETTAWKEFSVMESLAIPPQKPDMKKITSLNIEAKVMEFEVVKTPLTNANFEGVISTGYKLIVKGKLIQFIEYIADQCEQSAHSAHFEVPFCTYIVLPEYYQPGNSITVEAIVEDVYVEQTSIRCFFKNVTMFVYADICCGVADVELPVPKVVAFDPSVKVEDAGINVFNIEVCKNNLPQIINILSSPLSPIGLTTALPTGYTYNSGILTIASGVEGGTIGFAIESTPCKVPFTVNVIVASPPKVSMLSQTPANLKVGQLSETEFQVKYNVNQKEIGIANFIVEPYEVLAFVGSLPDGYTYANNVLTVNQKAVEASLNFVTKSGNCDLEITVNVVV